MAELFFADIDPSLPDEECAKQFDRALSALSEAERASEDGVELDQRDLDALKKLSRVANPHTRAEAVGILCSEDCSWDDLEEWSLDPDEQVRDAVDLNLRHGAANDLCASDRKRGIQMLYSRSARYGDWRPISMLADWAENHADCVDLTWNAVSRLLDLGGEGLVTGCIVCYLEHVIEGWGPDDPHVQLWIQGADHLRQMALLRAAAWGWGGETTEGDQRREIVKALTRSSAKDVSRLARGLLDGSVGYDGLLEVSEG